MLFRDLLDPLDGKIFASHIYVHSYNDVFFPLFREALVMARQAAAVVLAASIRQI